MRVVNALGGEGSVAHDGTKPSDFGSYLHAHGALSTIGKNGGRKDLQRNPMSRTRHKTKQLRNRNDKVENLREEE